ncbi:hypothetical protein PV05_08698 [Exophiala xenobiotica]|uniref:Intradiol ring-cleavage dioxygenases domain-containing protein n=1 Tax=Exophiala xenobiotica TaxID=348802 RepID=A0A0D2CSV8_9EURO|nr:uncharacterized protein PV05_08698 [Exophiala xenobiotica]KIW53102.1 hypothetical protein PV05_08698 [Exophiala xenobiotica]
MSATKSKPEDLTAENLTQHVIKTCTENVSHERTAVLIAGLIQHLHDYVREVQLRPGEWEAGWQYLTETGQFCTPDRQEMVLLSDVLGVSALVDTINSAQAKSSVATESSVLGPFHNDAETLENGGSIGSEGVVGEPMLIHGTVTSTDGEPIEGATVDVWETNGNGFYDMQDPNRDGPDCRGIFRTDKQGRFYLLGVKSVDYNIPDEGPVGKLLKILDRNVTRPAHVHFQLRHPTYIDLTTALYAADSAHITTDPVFGVKASLVKEFQRFDKLPEKALDYDLRYSPAQQDQVAKEGIWSLEHDFILVRK